MDDIAIKVENLSKVYKLYNKPLDRLKESLNPLRKKYHNDFFALRNINFEVKKGDRIGIIGRNGSGKSTLLKLLTGVLSPSGGNVQVNGRVSALLELGAGFNPEYTGIENIYFNATISGLSKEFIETKLGEIIEFADIGEFINQPVKSYSSGMFVRLAFALAVFIEPEILIIDEALSVGDIKFQQKAIRKMQDLMDNSKAILYVSHDMGSIRSFCDKVIWIKDGEIFQTGEPKKITQHYYDYMIHDILPNSEKKKSIKIDLESNETDNNNELNIMWDYTTTCNTTGEGKTEITKVSFYNKKPFEKMTVLEGNEDNVVFFMGIDVKENIYQPIIGFGIFNQYGVPIIHYNSVVMDKSINSFECGERIIIRFEFKLPKLCNGTYSISVGIDDGTLENHVVVKHVHESCIFRIERKDFVSKQYGLVIVEEADILVNVVNS